MEIHRGYEGLDLKNPVVTMGIFDGVHRGHREILDFLVKRAQETGGESVVVTFDPHPKLVLEKKTGDIFFLTSIDEKTALLAEAMVDHLVIIPFTRDFSRMSACDFLEKILAGKIGTRHLIVGYDHHFGSGGEGNFDTISKCSVSMDFKAEQVRKFTSDDVPVSSTTIREALIRGQVEKASGLLGYYYFLSGIVIGGRKLGKKLGFPTANIRPSWEYKLIPGNGVYAVEIERGNRKLKGMLSIGSNPTVNKPGSARSVEVNIFDFNEDIYGKDLTVYFRYRLREERKFNSTEQLTKQMQADKLIAHKLLG